MEHFNAISHKLYKDNIISRKVNIIPHFRRQVKQKISKENAWQIYHLVIEYAKNRRRNFQKRHIISYISYNVKRKTCHIFLRNCLTDEPSCGRICESFYRSTTLLLNIYHHKRGTYYIIFSNSSQAKSSAILPNFMLAFFPIIWYNTLIWNENTTNKKENKNDRLLPILPLRHHLHVLHHLLRPRLLRRFLPSEKQ